MSGNPTLSFAPALILCKRNQTEMIRLSPQSGNPTHREQERIAEAREKRRGLLVKGLRVGVPLSSDAMRIGVFQTGCLRPSIMRRSGY